MFAGGGASDEVERSSVPQPWSPKRAGHARITLADAMGNCDFEAALGKLEESTHVIRAHQQRTVQQHPPAASSHTPSPPPLVLALATPQPPSVEAYEAAVRAQEEAVAVMPLLLKRERDAAVAARERAHQAEEHAAELRAHLEEASRAERLRERAAGIALLSADDTENRVENRVEVREHAERALHGRHDAPVPDRLSRPRVASARLVLALSLASRHLWGSLSCPCVPPLRRST
jgi:hypothetical protein